MVVRRLCSAVCVLFLSACSVDLPGLLVSRDQDVRLKSRDQFHFLTEADRNLTLEDTYEFLVLTDTHIQDGEAFGFEHLSSVIRDARFVVVLGDITQYGSEKDIRQFIRIAKTLGVPCYPVIGNHDIYFNNWYNWRDHIGSSSYRVNGSNTTLFILDTANAWVGDAQIKWLDKELKTAQQHTFIFTHTNLFVEHIIDLQQTTDIRERARFMALLDGRCEAFFAGHVHRRIIKTFGGVQYITIEDFRTKKIYCRVKVSPEGIRYTFEKL